jgi:hypothetical protein
MHEVEDQPEWEEPTADRPSRGLMIARAAAMLVIMLVVGVALLIVLWLLVSIIISLISAI